MNDLNKDLSKRFLNYLDTQQYERLQFEVDMLGDINKQHPSTIFYYASSIFLQETLKDQDGNHGGYGSESHKKLINASDLFEKVYRSNNHIPSLHNMIAVSFRTKVFKKVMKLALKAHEKNEKDLKLVEGIARIHFYLGNRKESIGFFKKLYELIPDKKEGRLPFISSLNYASGISQEEYMKECKSYAALIEKELNVKEDNYKFGTKKNKKIKLSFISADFKNHSVSHFLKDLLIKIDKSKFEIHLISNLKTSEQDGVSQNLKKIVDKWHDVDEYSVDNLITFVRSLNLDILIDLSGYTQGNRHEILAKRCARIQMLWLGYNNSLGLKNLDYLISDKNLIKSNELSMYNEKILFLPKIWNALSPSENYPDIDTKKQNINFTFCSFNNFQKISDRTIKVWSEILKNDDSKILLKDSLAGGEDLKNNILNKFNINGVNKEKIIFMEREKKIYDHLKLYNKASVALDTFPYPGVTTSYEAIVMGLPVLTMKGFNFNSRCGESINKNLGLDFFIADNDEDYIYKANALKLEKNLSLKYGFSLREKALKSPLFDTDTFVKDFENLLKKVIN